MHKAIWQPLLPFDNIIFDCDGTLSTIEGIDVLAEHNGVGKEVTALTAEAMSETGLSQDLYEERLALVRPTQEQLINLGQEYYANRTEQAKEVMQIFKRLNKSLYIVSAGLFPAVKIFGELLHFPAENIFAVKIFFDAEGYYVDFEHTSSLVNRNGKRVIISEIIKNSSNTAFVGDGLNDLEASDMVARFIGYGGKFYRQHIADFCQYYIGTASFAPLLPLLLTKKEVESLDKKEEKILYAQGIESINQGLVKL